MNFVGM